MVAINDCEVTGSVAAAGVLPSFLPLSLSLARPPRRGSGSQQPLLMTEEGEGERGQLQLGGLDCGCDGGGGGDHG